MKNYLLLTTALVLSSSVCVSAQMIEDNVTIEDDVISQTQPTEVYGAAANAQGGENAAFVEQAPGAPNPLGSPIVDPDSPQSSQSDVSVGPAPSQEASSTPSQMPAEPQIKPIQQESQQGILQPGELALPQPSTRIENELYQSGNDIIDVQAYPIDDVSTVTEPNIQPTIVSQ